MSRTIRLVAVALVCNITLVTTGCMRTRALWVAPYERGTELTMRPAPETGVYKVNWAVEAGKTSFGLEESRIAVEAGDPIGFATDEDGRVFALAGTKELPLDGLNPQARYCVWQCELTEPTPFGSAMRTLGSRRLDGEAIFDGFLESALDSLVGDDDEDECSYQIPGTSKKDDDDDDDDDRRNRRSDPNDRGERYRRGSGRGDGIRIKRD